MRNEIEEAKNEPEPNPTAVSLPVGQSRERLAWRVSVLTTLVAVALAIPTVAHFRETVSETQTVRSTILPPVNTTLDFTQGIGLPVLSPDGRRLVFGARTADGKTSLWNRSLDGLNAQALAGTEGAAFPFWSPDSRFIAFFADGKLKKIDASGGPAFTLTDAPNGRGGTWNHDGVIVFAPTSAPGLQRVSSAGGTSSPISAIQGTFPWFLPDGQHFLFQEQQTATNTSAELPFRVSSLAGSQSKVLGTGSNVIYAQGNLLFLHEGTLLAQPLDAERLEAKGEAVPVAEQIQTVLNSGRVGVFSASETGLLVYRAGGGRRTQLTWFDRTGKAAGTLGDPDRDGSPGNPELSPDGQRVVSERNVNGNLDVWLIDILRGAFTRFTFDAATDDYPLWSWDGKQIIFSSNRKKTIDLFIKSSSGAGSEQILLEPSDPRIAFSWSTDGRFLLYGENNSKTLADLWALPMQGERKPITVANSPFSESNGQFSPDGRWVAYQSNESGRFEIYVVPFPPGGGKWQISTSGGVSPRWRHDGKELFFIGPDGLMMATTVSASGTAFETAPPVSLFQTRLDGSVIAGSTKHQYAVSSDGRFLINTPSDSGGQPITLIQSWKAAAK